MSWLHVLGNAIRDGLAQIPLPLVRAAFVAIPLLLLLWVWRLPVSATSPPAGARRWDENLKAVATIALVVQIVIYLCL